MIDNKIRILSDDVVNEIAAGEVIERPASVVKELIENSIDAKSTRVDVFLIDGGKKEIVVVDDGEGMSKRDLELCFFRHSTSKINKIGDLLSLSTYGFRGEALSSIASVSTLKITSRTLESDSGYEIKVKRGVLVDQIAPVASPIGTSVSVNEIFYDVPARLKFLRSESTEYQYCARTLKELALARSNVKFFLYHNGRLVTEYSLPRVQDRVQECLKPSWQNIEVDEAIDGLSIFAILSEPCFMQDRGELFIYVNGRSVKNRELFSVVRKTYSEILGAHHEPSGVIYLDIRKDWVDANVHPQKTEVRCYQVEKIYQWIKSVIRKSITTNRTVMKVNLPLEIPYEDLNSIYDRTTSYGAVSYKAQETKQSKSVEFKQLEFNETREKIKYIGQIRNSYILLEDDMGIIIIDQHALHEKKRFEAIKDAYSTRSINSQKLLVPKIVHLKEELVEVFERNKTIFADFGFDVENFGNGDLVVKAYPEIIDECSVEAILIECLYEMNNEFKNSKEVVIESLNSIFAKMACKGSITANMRLSHEEINGLIKDDLFQIKESLTCPHGRPILFRIEYKELEKHFGRLR